MPDRSATEVDLEHRTAQALHGLPQRRAPLTLESRVFDELRRRAALRWWQRHFMHWPLLARAAFIGVCVAVIGLTVAGSAWQATGLPSFNDLGALPLSWGHWVIVLLTLGGGLATALAGMIPPFWLYVGLVTGSLLYAVLFGLGAAAYRTLYLQNPLHSQSDRQVIQS